MVIITHDIFIFIIGLHILSKHLQFHFVPLTFANNCKIWHQIKKGILLMNLGSPDSTEVTDVRKYLDRVFNG